MVDEARWSWRGRRWAHLTSDVDLDELHRFAARAGLHRISFGGDHYDVTDAQRSAALAAGAEAVGSRELVRRLRAAGLRRPAGQGSHRWQPLVDTPWPLRAPATASDNVERLTTIVGDATGWLPEPATATAVVDIAGLAEPAAPDQRVELRILHRRDELAITVTHQPVAAPEEPAAIDGGPSGRLLAQLVVGEDTDRPGQPGAVVGWWRWQERQGTFTEIFIRTAAAPTTLRGGEHWCATMP